MGHAVAVIGAGVRTPAGNTMEALWAFLLEGRSSARLDTDGGLPSDLPVLTCRVDGLHLGGYLTSQDARRTDRASGLAIAAAEDALAGVSDKPAPERCAVVCGTGFGSTATIEQQISRFALEGVRGVSPLAIPMMMPNQAASLLSQRFGFGGPCHTIAMACASGSAAIGEGVELLRRGAADLVLAGGVDSMVSGSALAGFLRLDAMSRNLAHPELACRPFDAERDGFVMGEGAGFVVLVRIADAPAAGREVLGQVLGYGTCADAHHLVAPRPDGAGARRSMTLALENAGVGAGDVNHVNAHGTGTVANDLAEAIALNQLFGPAGPPVTAVKGATGHMMGGSGAVEAIVTLRSLSEGVAPPVAGLRSIDSRMMIDAITGEPRQIGPGCGLTNSFGFGGSNVALVLSA